MAESKRELPSIGPVDALIIALRYGLKQSKGAFDLGAFLRNCSYLGRAEGNQLRRRALKEIAAFKKNGNRLQ